ncbi:related to Probable beta-glucosidase btgE [Rhynchosporium secalis]|uniref:Probable beta-glucosidase btgE n=1 Tax=Rhynchosporium secalis TaxID=38038 RepID=A0A1E1ML98_RHYSE|nr:related to Probable beta-glucosidase btgE [Rhynchosporium secalis]
MKAGFVAVAAALVASAAAQPGEQHARRHAHEAFHERGVHPDGAAITGTGSAPESTCGCTTIYKTITGEGSLIFPPAPTYAPNTTIPVPSTTSPAPVVPTPQITVCPTPGVYTIPATTITVTNTTTVCGATSTHIPPGVHTGGGVTTVVTNATTVVCPYAAVETNGNVTTSIIKTTTYVCPTPGIYTIAPFTTTANASTIWVYPTPVTYPPGNYTQPETVTTITKTNYVVVCPFTSVGPVSTSAPAPAPTPSYVAAVVPTYAPAPIVPSPAPKPVSTYKAEVPTYAPAPVVSPPTKPSTPPVVSPPKSSPKPHDHLGSSGTKWAMTYSPYSDAGQCKDKATVAADIARIARAGFSTVRMYSTDCSGLENIGSACETHNLKIILGVFISHTGIAAAQEQVTDIVHWKKWGMVELVVVGNEAIFSGAASGSDLAPFIVSCKQALQAAGYNGPVTTTEPLDVWQKNTAVLCPVVDVVGCNIHSFFNAETDAEHAGEFVASQLKIVDKLCPGKSGLNLETGWPSAGISNNKAVPGKAEQAIAIKGISAAAGGRSVMFSMINDLWKDPGAFGCERSWGAIQIFE